MSDVNPYDLKQIDTAEDVLHLYQGAGKNMKTGAEIELAFFDPASPKLTPMSVPQNRVVKNAANAALNEDWVRNEPTSETLEAISMPVAADHLQTAMDDLNKKISMLSRKAQNIGLKRSYFQDLPEQPATELLKSIVDIPRYQAFFNPPRADMTDIAAYFAASKSNQISVSYRDPDHMLENIRRLYFLAPFLFLLTDNSSGFMEGKNFSGHSGMEFRASLKDRGGVPPYIFTAKTGAEYIAAHIDNVMNNPLYVHYNEKGELIRLPSGVWTSFNKLREHNLNTATNYFFAQTILWPDVKIAALKNESGEITGHRYEARMFGVGVHQHQTALLIVAGLAFNPDFARKTDLLLARFGFSMKNGEASRNHLSTAYKNARHHGGRFMDIDYGTATMRDFAKDFADLLEDAYLATNYEDALAPALMIARTGCTDGKINRLLFPALDDVKRQQQEYDPSIFENPNRNVRMIYAREIKALGAESCTAGV